MPALPFAPAQICCQDVNSSVLRAATSRIPNSLLCRANSSTCTNTTGAPALDTTADGVLFHPCIAEQDGMSALVSGLGSAGRVNVFGGGGGVGVTVSIWEHSQAGELFRPIAGSDIPCQLALAPYCPDLQPT